MQPPDRNRPASSYLSSTPAGHQSGDIRVAADYEVFTFTRKVSAARYPKRACNGTSSLDSPTLLSFHASCDHLLLCDPKNIALSLIPSVAFLTMLPPLHLGLFFLLAMAYFTGADPVFCILQDGYTSSA